MPKVGKRGKPVEKTDAQQTMESREPEITEVAPKVSKRAKNLTENSGRKIAVPTDTDNAKLNETYNVSVPVKEHVKPDKQNKGRKGTKGKSPSSPSDENSEPKKVEENALNENDEDVANSSAENNGEQDGISPKGGSKSKIKPEQEPPYKKSRNVEKSEEIKSKGRGGRKKAVPVKIDDLESDVENDIKSNEESPEYKPKAGGRKKTAAKNAANSAPEAENDEELDEHVVEDGVAAKPKRGRKPKETTAPKVGKTSKKVNEKEKKSKVVSRKKTTAKK